MAIKQIVSVIIEFLYEKFYHLINIKKGECTLCNKLNSKHLQKILLKDWKKALMIFLSQMKVVHIAY
nr:MAG TPA_asm: hypothetical protein [Caudoviricetes sp.]